MAPSREYLLAEEASDLTTLVEAELMVAAGYQPSPQIWDMAAKHVVLGILDSRSDVALAMYSSRENTPASSVESFADDGNGPNRHIPAFLRYPSTPASVLAVIEEALPGIDVELPACHRAAANMYGLWCCPSDRCSYFVDVAHMRPEEVAYVRQHDVGRAGIAVSASGVGRIVPGEPMAARMLLQLLASRHLELAHLSRRGLEMVISENMQFVTWKWKTDWLELMPDIQAAAAEDERGKTQKIRRWLSEKGARACDRLRRPFWLQYRLWARADRAHRKEVVQSALETGMDERAIALQLAWDCRLADSSDRSAEAFDAQATAEALDRDIENFRQLTVRPWPREYPTWESLSDKERDEVMEVYATGDPSALWKCERRVYNVPFLAKW